MVVPLGLYMARVSMLTLVAAAWIWPSPIWETTAAAAALVDALLVMALVVAGAWIWPSLICETTAPLLDALLVMVVGA